MINVVYVIVNKCYRSFKKGKKKILSGRIYYCTSRPSFIIGALGSYSCGCGLTWCVLMVTSSSTLRDVAACFVVILLQSSSILRDVAASSTRRDAASSESCSLPPPYVCLHRRGGCQTQQMIKLIKKTRSTI